MRIIFLTAFVYIFLFSMGAAADDAITPPRIKEWRDAKMPHLARARKWCGTATVKFMVNEKGRAESPEVIRSSHKIFNLNALKAIRKSKFFPASKDGKPVSYGPISYLIKFQSQGYCTNVDFGVLDKPVPLDELPSHSDLSVWSCLVSYYRGNRDRNYAPGGYNGASTNSKTIGLPKQSLKVRNECPFPVEFSMCIYDDRRARCKLNKTLKSEGGTTIASNLSSEQLGGSQPLVLLAM